jgi:uncharacterized protein YgbK (DUF1537 family)
MTAFARDPAFAFRSSNLRDWIAEKWPVDSLLPAIESISLHELRTGGPDVVTARLTQLATGSIMIVNAAHPRDLDVFTLGALHVEEAGRRLLYRTAGQIVASRLGLEDRPLWRPDATADRLSNGGLVVIGSHVPKTSRQLESLLRRAPEAEQIELNVARVLDSERRDAELIRLVADVAAKLKAGCDVILFTSRSVAPADSAERSLEIAASVSAALVNIVAALDCQPAFLVAKGGITSSDVATAALGVKRAKVLGQVAPGVPVWRLGPETKFPDRPYIVFPGNVGTDDTLADVFEALASPLSPQTSSSDLKSL